MGISSFAFSGLILFLLLLPSPAASSCFSSDRKLISRAFFTVSGFRLPPPTGPDSLDCSSISLPSRNLSGVVSWMHLRGVFALRAIDLSGNALHGSIPRGFWSAPALLHFNLAGNRLSGALRFNQSSPHGPPLRRLGWVTPTWRRPKPRVTRVLSLGRSVFRCALVFFHTRGPPLRSLNLTGNKFTSAAGLAALRSLEVLDLSRNNLGLVPPGLEKLHQLQHLDVSHNSMTGALPRAFSRLARRLAYLNVSHNNISDVVQAETAKKFGKLVFFKADSLRLASSSASVAHSSSPKSASPRRMLRRRRRYRYRTRVVLGVVPTIVVVAVIVVTVCCCYLWAGKEVKEEEGKGEMAAAAGGGGEGGGAGDTVKEI
ncbi:putative LRR receptor-like serine/threonine-protein kinase [Canna indica]|uniref:LRR receptor-like serine/threonine-protein kinase n=1 Tax=Canna indica TaxID=4628 RepID=A0AAQ3QBY7_9LILI|nr:putative LRR receptor-like serine/threonine-protein kinase [Canna indica]